MYTDWTGIAAFALFWGSMCFVAGMLTAAPVLYKLGITPSWRSMGRAAIILIVSIAITFFGLPMIMYETLGRGPSFLETPVLIVLFGTISDVVMMRQLLAVQFVTSKYLWVLLWNLFCVASIPVIYLALCVTFAIVFGPSGNSPLAKWIFH